VSCGQAVRTLAASAGISALLVASEPAFMTVKYLGAAYLVYLGLHAMWSVARQEPAAPASRPGAVRWPAITAACWQSSNLEQRPELARVDSTQPWRPHAHKAIAA
jgi:threonine/homoserine/homoserine lactone efflux protein